MNLLKTVIITDHIVTDMIQRQGKSYMAGTWTDDTSMTICLAESILNKWELDHYDQLDKYSSWLNRTVFI